MSEQNAEKEAICPTCGPTTLRQHPRESHVLRCSNCCEWLRVTPPAQTSDAKETR